MMFSYAGFPKIAKDWLALESILRKAKLMRTVDRANVVYNLLQQPVLCFSALHTL
jgi:hypothetical protein